MATVLPSDASYSLVELRPCAAMDGKSRAFRRRMRDRRVSIRRSQSQSLELMGLISEACDVSQTSVLRADAAEFVCHSNVSVDWESLCFRLREDDVKAEGETTMGKSCSIPARREVRDTCLAERLPELPEVNIDNCKVVCLQMSPTEGLATVKARSTPKAAVIGVESANVETLAEPLARMRVAKVDIV